MQVIWKTIETTLATRAPNIFESLNPGATDSEIRILEATLQTVLPADFVQFYQIHNVQQSNRGGIFNGEELLPCARIAEEWTIWKPLLDGGGFSQNGAPLISNPDTGIKNDWWNPLWIPFTYNVRCNHYCLDLDPAPEGSWGQIITLWADDPDRNLVAHSFKGWIANYAGRLFAGKMVY